MTETTRGFILQPTYRMRQGQPVVRLFGRLEAGGSFLVRDARPRPYFYIETRDSARARELGASRLEPTERVDFHNQPVSRVQVARPADLRGLRERLENGGVVCYEADLRFATRYLIDRNLRGSVEIRGRWQAGERIDRIYDDPELLPVDGSPRLRVLSIDLETDPTARNILSAALSYRDLGHGPGPTASGSTRSGSTRSGSTTSGSPRSGSRAVVLLLASERHSSPEGAIPVHSQRELMDELCRHVRRIDPDVITGWNVIDFDFRVLLRRAQQVGARLELGRASGETRWIESRGPRQMNRIEIPGRLVLDGLHIVRGSSLKLERYSLEAVAREILGQGKDLSGGGRAETILHWFRHQRQRLVDYNLKDAELVLDILERTGLIELTVARSRLTGLPLDRASSSIAAFDFLYLAKLYRRGIVAASIRADAEVVPMPGGHVLTPKPGLHRNVLSFDFKSLYPSIIRTFQIDPLGLVDSTDPRNPVPSRQPGHGSESGTDDLIVAPNGAAFRRRRGILTEILDELFPRREAAKRQGRTSESDAIKLLMNSLYGVLGTTASRFYDPRLPAAITGFGKRLLLWSRSYVQARGLRVLYGDTDSLFVEAPVTEPEEALDFGRDLAARLTADLAVYVDEEWRVASRLELELERLYLRLFLPSLRHSTVGAMKRYAGLMYLPASSSKSKEEPSAELVFVGLESVRRDWTQLAKRAQRKLFELLFNDRSVVEPLRELVEKLRQGKLDDLLVYRKGLRKRLEEYTATTPPHVAAARKSTRPPRRVVEYVMTVSGPELAAEQSHDFDYEHYVDRQLRPIAEPVLEHLGLEFGKVIGDDRQIDLFP